ncbi:MAG: Fic family protein [Actinomycetota bacterium]|nr:Fic family protein [Actinomycetota bacterium]
MRGSFGPGHLEQTTVPMPTVRSIGLLGEYKGKQQLFERQSQQALSALREVARVQSIESSNRIEGVTAASGRIAELAADKAMPRDRSEQEIAGYRDVLSTVHANASEMEVSTGLILELHRDMYQFSPAPGGAWKSSPNDIVDVMPDGTHRLRFSPVAPNLVEPAMGELVAGYQRIASEGLVDPLIAVPAFVLDFLCIHPFGDGNGRLSRILNLMLLYQAGFDVGRYISFEKIIEDSKETYYEALEASSAGWHEGGHDLLPWLQYSHGVLLAAYLEFEQRVGQMVTGRGAKREMVIDCINHLPMTFRYADVERACPGVSRPTIVRVLGELRDTGEIRCTKGGRDAAWERMAR